LCLLTFWTSTSNRATRNSSLISVPRNQTKFEFLLRNRGTTKSGWIYVHSPLQINIIAFFLVFVLRVGGGGVQLFFVRRYVCRSTYICGIIILCKIFNQNKQC
jgi:hypothetical protein